MQPRHWDRIATITGHVFDVDADNFLLRNLMMAPLLQNSEDIEVLLRNLMMAPLLQNSEDIEVPSRAPARPPSMQQRTCSRH